MKTVFINGLMLPRSKELVRALCREFIVVGIGFKDLNESLGTNVVDPFDSIKETDFMHDKDFVDEVVAQTKILNENLSRDVSVSPLGPAPGWSLDKHKHEQVVMRKVANILYQMQVFKKFNALQPVHMLISGADYSSHSRPLVMVAKDLNIPSLDVEHGFFFSTMFAKFKPDQGNIPTLFASDFVNLDNNLEVSIISDHLAAFPTLSPQLLAMGTPGDTVAGHAPSKKTARSLLGLDPDRKQVLLLGSWIEARMAGSLLSGQLDTIKLYSDLFEKLASSELRHQIDLMIKLHPADCAPNVFPHVSACLMDLAQQNGLPAPTIYTDRLAEVLAAADVVLTVSWTSLIWDAFLMEKPTVMLLPEYLKESFKPGWQQKGNIPLAEGIVLAAEDAREAWVFAENCLTQGYQQELVSNCRKLRKKYDLRDKTIQEKSIEITQWVADFKQPDVAQ